MAVCVDELSRELRPPLTAEAALIEADRCLECGGLRRFAHLFRPGSEGLVRQIQGQVDAEWDALLARCGDALA